MKILVTGGCGFIMSNFIRGILDNHGDWEIVKSESGIGIHVKSKYGWIALHINLEPSNLQLATSLVRAGELIDGYRDVKPYEGWVSPTYGAKVPALSLAVEVQSSKSISFISDFIFPK